MFIENMDRTNTYGDKYIVFKEKIKGTLGFICPKCRTMRTIYIDKNIDMNIDPRDVDVIIRHLTLTLTCHRCKYVWNVNDDDGIDTNMITAISVLNTNGYATVLSCEGHLEEAACLPYICFKDSFIEIMGAPHGWEFEPYEKDNTKTIMIWKGNFECSADKASALDSLYEWIYECFDIEEDGK